MDPLMSLRQIADRNGALLARNKRHGDDLEKPRIVTFELLGDLQERADAACSFINECGYGEAFVSDDIGWSLVGEETPGWRVMVRMRIPTTPSALQCCSGLLFVVAEQHGLSYEGWMCGLMTS